MTPTTTLTTGMRAKYIDIGLSALKRYQTPPDNDDLVILALHAVGIMPSVIVQIIDEVKEIATASAAGGVCPSGPALCRAGRLAPSKLPARGTLRAVLP